MKYYVASGVRNAEKVNLAAAALNAAASIGATRLSPEIIAEV